MEIKQTSSLQSKSRTDFAGMYWPAEILEKTAKGYRVLYDNGDKDLVDADQICPSEHPTEFGKEEIPLQVGEFVEIHNNSKTDPAAWIGLIKKVQGTSFVVRSTLKVLHNIPSCAGLLVTLCPIAVKVVVLNVFRHQRGFPDESELLYLCIWYRYHTPFTTLKTRL